MDLCLAVRAINRAGYVTVAGTMANTPNRPAVETATAGWVVGFLAGIATYFQTAATRDTDRCLVIAGLPASWHVLAHPLTGQLPAGQAAMTRQRYRPGDRPEDAERCGARQTGCTPTTTSRPRRTRRPPASKPRPQPVSQST